MIDNKKTLNYTIDYNKIIPGSLNAFITKEELDKIKELAIKERETMTRKLYRADSFTKFFAPKKAEELAYGSKYSNFNSVEKAILAANIALPDEKVERALADNELFGFEYLKHYLKIVDYFRYARPHDGEIPTEEVAAKKFMTNYNRALVNRFTMYFGSINPSLIINKINEIVSFNPQLLDSKHR